jgi:tetratricopeptide (TPR) repeat protein
VSRGEHNGDTSRDGPAAPPDATVSGALQISARRRVLFTLVLLLLPPLVFFAALEGGLRLAGYGRPAAFFLKIPGRDAYTTNQDFGLRFFPPSLVRTPQPCVLPKKAPGTYRIFTFGESAALGIPDPAFGFSRVLEAMLNERFPGARFEVINAAMTAISSHVVLPIAADCAKMEPDLFVVYMGNNEVIGPYGVGTVFGGFSPHLTLIRAAIRIKATRTGQLLTSLFYRLKQGRGPAPHWHAMEMFREKRIRADDPRMQVVYDHFERNLVDICRNAHRAGAPTVLCTMGANLKDNPPFASLHRLDLDPATEGRWQQLYQAGVSLAASGQFPEAIATLGQAAEIDDHYADLHYLLGRCYWSIGEYADAREQYALANEWDALRFRSDRRINDTIRQVAAAGAGLGIQLVDAEEAYRSNERTLHRTPGEELFYEHVHMNWEGTYLLAASVYQQVVTMLPDDILRRATGTLEAPSLRSCAERLVFTPWDRCRLFGQVSAMMNKPPFSDQLGHEEARESRRARLLKLQQDLTPQIMQQIMAVYLDAVRKMPNDLYIPQRLAQLLGEKGDAGKAEYLWRGLLERIPSYLEWQSELAKALSEQGKSAEAIDILARVVRAKPDAAEYRNNLGRALASANKVSDAIGQYRRAARIDPYMPETYNNLGMALAQEGQTAEALEQYEHTLELDPRFVDAHLNAAAIYEGQGNLDQAILHYREALKQQPASATVNHSLGLALAESGRIDEAIDLFRAAVALRPDVLEMRSNLATAYTKVGRTAEAIEQYRECIRLAPTQSDAYFWLGDLLSEDPRSGREAVAMFRKAIELAPAWIPPLHRLAHVLATHPDPSIRNGQEAVALANRACESTRYGDPNVLETAAAAYAEIGDFDRAIEFIARARPLAGAAGDQSLLQRLAEEGELYKLRRPLREHTRAAG